MNLIDFMLLERLDIILVQEHNIKDLSRLEYIDKHYNILLNASFLLKGGTAILVNRVSSVKILKHEMDVKRQILSAECEIFDTVLQMINVYAPSGNNKKKGRDDLFQNDLLYFVRKNLRNLILGGDWNCITSMRDCSSNDNILMSKALGYLKNTLKRKDIWLLTNKTIEYTYVKQGYGSRLDRIYVRDLGSNITEAKTIPISWSDHSVLKTRIKLEHDISFGKGYWKLNCSLLDKSVIMDNVHLQWNSLKMEMYGMNFNSVLDWWVYAKKQVNFSS